MSGRSVTSFLSLNRNLRSGSGEFRFLRLPRVSPFPKLDRPPIAALPLTGGGVRRAGANLVPAIIGGSGELPEMMTDLIDASTTYAESNVRRSENRAPRALSKVGFALLKEKVLGSHRATRL